MRFIIDCCACLRLELSTVTASNSLSAGPRIFVGTTCFKMFTSRFRISESELILKVGFVYVVMTFLSCEWTLRSGMFRSVLNVRYSSELRSASSYEVLLARSCLCVEQWVYGNRIPRLLLFLFRSDGSYCYCIFCKNWLQTIRYFKSSACMQFKLCAVILQPPYSFSSFSFDKSICWHIQIATLIFAPPQNWPIVKITVWCPSLVPMILILVFLIRPGEFQ
jgi:hypothetical protein